LAVLFALISLALIFAAARSSARCILRSKQLPSESAKEVAAILSGALFLVYVFAALVAYFLAAPNSAGSLRQLLSPQNSLLASAASQTANPSSAEMPQGRMPAEQGRADRLLLLEETEELLHQETDARCQLFGQEHAYIVAEGISGIEDRYIPPRPEQLAPPAETSAPDLPSISVRELVSSSDDISSMLPTQEPAPAPPSLQPAAAQQAMPPVSAPAQTYPALSMPTQPAEKRLLQPESLPEQLPRPEVPVSRIPPVQYQHASGIDQQIWAQEQRAAQSAPAAAQQVSCEEIRSYMDGTDLGVFRYAITQPTGVVTPWKNPSGSSYTITAGAAQGGCRDYALQAVLGGRNLRCRFSCVSSPARQPRSDKEVIRDAMNSSDQEAFMKALTYHGPVSWRSSSGIFYTVAPVRLSGPCRKYDVQANIQGRVFRYLESNCE